MISAKITNPSLSDIPSLKKIWKDIEDVSCYVCLVGLWMLFDFGGAYFHFPLKNHEYILF